MNYLGRRQKAQILNGRLVGTFHPNRLTSTMLRCIVGLDTACFFRKVDLLFNLLRERSGTPVFSVDEFPSLVGSGLITTQNALTTEEILTASRFPNTRSEDWESGSKTHSSPRLNIGKEKNRHSRARFFVLIVP